MKEYWKMETDHIKDMFGVTNSGLSDKDVSKIRERVGENLLEEEKKQNIFQVFLSQFCDLLVVILLIAATISAFSDSMESTIVIIAVLILNSILGTVQHVKAEKSLEGLKQLSSPSAKVIRNGKKIQVASKDIVPGDILVLEAGDLIVADGRIIENYSLQVNESSLTGESTNVEKRDVVLDGDVPLGDRVNMVYSGSLVVYGRAVVLVTATGMNTEIGKIAGLMNQTKDRKTPLQKSLDQFSGRLAIGIMIISAIVFGLCFLRGNNTLIDSIMFAVALAVAAIPEALGSIVTIVQAIGTQKMATQNAIIKDLKAVESLGCVSVICSDKTGTLTQNKMTVKKVYINDEILEPEEIDIKKQSHRYLLYNAILSNDSTIVDGKGIGDPTEYALLEMYRKVKTENENINLYEEDIRQQIKRIEEIPFDSDRKLMSIKCKLHGKDTVLTKGAVDVLLDRCLKVRFNDEIKNFTDEEKNKIIKQNEEFSKQGLRVLAFAYKETNEELSIETENNYVFLGLIAMIDPPREESIDAVRKAKQAGIKTVMITGDHKITAIAIAKEIGIFEDGDIAVTGLELDAMSDEELYDNIDKISVYARVSPENKIRIVEAWQKHGNIVSMTGDGVNDAPALKKADIGVAMGITGTEVSKDASSMILSDDNFATIIKAVSNGRNVYRNIKNAILYLLSGNMAGILSVLYASIAGIEMPFTAVHLLFMNLLTDSLPAIAIGMEIPDESLLKEKPRNPKESILTKDFILSVMLQGGLIAVATMTGYYVGLGKNHNSMLASTMAFSILTIARLFHGINCRGKESIFRLKLKTNVYEIMAFFAGMVFIGIVWFVSGLHDVFNIADISAINIAEIIVLAFIPTFIIQIVKVIKDKMSD